MRDEGLGVIGWLGGWKLFSFFFLESMLGRGWGGGDEMCMWV